MFLDVGVLCFLFCLLLKLFLCAVLLLCFGIWLACLVCVLVFCWLLFIIVFTLGGFDCLWYWCVMATCLCLILQVWLVLLVVVVKVVWVLVVCSLWICVMVIVSVCGLVVGGGSLLCCVFVCSIVLVWFVCFVETCCCWLMVDLLLFGFGAVVLLRVFACVVYCGVRFLVASACELFGCYVCVVWFSV